MFYKAMSFTEVSVRIMSTKALSKIAGVRTSFSHIFNFSLNLHSNHVGQVL